jgi:predicted PurR-regulated permease PerM
MLPDARSSLPAMRAARPESNRLLTLATVVAIVAVLYLARALLIPIAFAIVLAFVLAPPVSWLERLGIGRVAAVATTVGTSALAIALVGWLVAAQSLALVSELPRQRELIRAKLAVLETRTDGWLSRAREGMAVLREEIVDREGRPEPGPGGSTGPTVGSDSTTGAAPLGALVDGPPGPRTPQELEGRGPPSDEPATSDAIGLADAADRLLDIVVSAGIVAIFVTVILLKREDLRDRALALAGAERLHLSTQIVDDAAHRVSRFLLTQLLVNIAFGAAIAVGLFVIGVPNAILFGALVVPLRFVPLVGLWIAAGVPIAVAALNFDGWTVPLLTTGLFVLVEVVIASVVEPWAFGTRTGISVAAVVLALVFWTWLWGAPGLVLAMPLTVCLAAVARQLPSHRWLRVLLDDRPTLPESARVYQRLLALDADEAMGIARASMAQRGLAATYDTVLLPALTMLERDRHAGSIDESRERFALDELRDIVDTLADEAPGATSPTDLQPGVRDAQVICLPAGDLGDEIAAAMLARLLDRRGVPTTVLASSSLFSERIAAAAKSRPAQLCVSAVPPSAELQARRACKGLREPDAEPSIRLIVGLWGAVSDAAQRERLSKAGADIVVHDLSNAVRAIAGEGALP